MPLMRLKSSMNRRPRVLVSPLSPSDLRRDDARCNEDEVVFLLLCRRCRSTSRSEIGGRRRCSTNSKGMILFVAVTVVFVKSLTIEADDDVPLRTSSANCEGMVLFLKFFVPCLK